MKNKSSIQLGNLIIIIASFLAITLLMYFVGAETYHWHLYMIPLLIGIFTYGLGGGLAVWLAFAGYVVWSIAYGKGVVEQSGALVDLILGLCIAVGLGVYEKRVKKTKALLEKLSEKDSLTGLENYGHFSSRLTEEKNRSDRYETPFSLILMDIDDFKKFNDSYGHEAGNEVLKRIADTIQSHTRNVDLGVRYGGEELAVVLTNADAKAALGFAKRLHGAIGEQTFHFAGGKQSISVSMGVSTYPKDANSETELIVYADQALYKAKGEGKNRICVYNTPNNYCPLDKILV